MDNAIGVTFSVSDVEVGPLEAIDTISIRESLRRTTRVEMEACGSNFSNMELLSPYRSPMNGLVLAVHTAFDQHLPLALTPDAVWLAIAQGFASHVNENAELLRKQFVAHEGKVYIEVQRNEFVKGSPGNPWMDVFSEFSDKIAEHVGKKRDLLVNGFSTTGPIERAASEIVLMDAMKSYFDYGFRTRCGIPEITLLGTVDDWRQIRDRASVLAEFHCKEWIDHLLPILSQFVEAYSGNPNPQFWRNIYKLNSGSGGPFVGGWINAFFPYLSMNNRLRSNQCALWNPQSSRFGGPTPDSFPNGLSSVPFTWHYYGQSLSMQFLGGFVGAVQDPSTKVVQPAIGWGVGPDGSTEDKPAD